MMNGRYRVIDEVSFNILGTFDSQEGAIDFVAALLSANDDDYLDELTIACDDQPLFSGVSLRDALKHRAVARDRVGTPVRGA